MTFLFAIIIFLEIIQWIVLIDVILSWLTLLGIRIRPKFISDIIDPLYKNVRNLIPTTLGPVDFTPIIIIFFLMFLRGALFILFPELQAFSLHILQ